MHEKIPSEIIAKFQAKYDSLKQQGYWVGEPIEPGIYRTLDGGWQCNYGGWCAIVMRPGETEPHEVHGAIGQRWYKEWGAFDISGKLGSLGHPISDEEVYDGDGDPNDRISHFENGDVIWTAKTDATRVVNIKDRARWYKTKHDQLLDLLRRAVEAPAPERHNEALKAVEEKCKADQFDVVFLGEFQSGKSTTLDILCGGREISPQGSGITPTSSVPVSIEALQPGEPDEWAEIKFKDKRILASELFSAFEGEILDPESNHQLKQFVAGEEGSARDRFCSALDFDNPANLNYARSSLKEAWGRYHENSESKYRFSTRQRQLMEVVTLVVRFYDSQERLEMSGKERCPVSEVRGYVWFPTDWQENASQGFDYDITFDDARFAFVEKVILHIDSHFAKQLGCRVTDCPGLDASAYDKEITQRALRRADGVLYFHQCKKAIGASALGSMFEFVEDTGRTSKTVLALHLWGIPCGKALGDYIDHNGRKKTGVVPGCKQQLAKENYHFPVIWCHVLLAYLSAIADKKLRTGEPFAAQERCWLYEKAGEEGDPPTGWSDERLWLAALHEINHLFKVPGLDTITALDATAVQAVGKASNFDELLGAVKETVLREKTGSILIDNGSKKALETLRSHETELQLKEDVAKENEKKCADEVAAAKVDLDEYEKETKSAVQGSQFVLRKDDAMKSLSRSLVDDVLSPDFHEGLSKHIGKVVRDLNKRGYWFKEDFKRALRAEVGPLIAGYFRDRAIVMLEKWQKMPNGRWKLFCGDIEELSDQIHVIGAARFGGKRIFQGEPLPSMPANINDGEISGKITDSFDGLDNVAESLREGFFTQLCYVATWVFNKIREFFGIGETEEEIIAGYSKKIQPELEKAFRDMSTCQILENGVRPVFEEIHKEFLDSLDKSRSAYRKKIEARCDELIELHRSSDAELHRIAEENRRLREEIIAPLRAEIEAFETTVKTAQP